jgi:protein tyrosine phosphatase
MKEEENKIQEEAKVKKIKKNKKLNDKKSTEFKKEEIEEENNQKMFHSINKLIAKSNENGINMNINITPYENRIVIPKI